MTIKLNQFYDLLEALRKFGITNFSALEIEKEKKQFETYGLDTDISDVFPTNSGELFVVLKDGSIGKAVIHIVDMSTWPSKWGYPRFHIWDCKKLTEMRVNKKYHRYKATSQKTGKFYLINKERKWYESLEICSYCLTLYNKRFKTNCTKQNFLLKEYIEKPLNSSGFLKVQWDICTVPNTYTESWPAISEEMKKRAKYICTLCWKDLSRPQCKKFLHTHHINADKKNNTSGNLQVLCIKCHSKEHNHEHIKFSKMYKEYLNSVCSECQCSKNTNKIKLGGLKP